MPTAKRCAAFLLIVWAALTAPAAAAERPPPPAPAGEIAATGDAAPADNTWADRYHLLIENDLYGTVTWFDHFFEDDLRRDPGSARSSLRWTNEVRWDQQDGFRYRTKVRASVRLPHLLGRWRFVISGESKGDPTAIKPEDPGNPGLAVAANSRRASTELVYDLLQTRNTIVDFGAGVQVKLPPNVYVRTRLLHVRELAYAVIARLTVTPFWEARDGFGESNQLDIERQFGPRMLLRWSNSANITEQSNGWNWGTELSVFERLSPKSAITFAGNASGPTRPETVVQNYRVYTRYRRNFLRTWLFFELEPDVNWPRQDDGSRRTVWGGTVRVEIDFLGNELSR
jgi:hypothetical protein